jgi:hypothetical protein
VHLAFVMLIQDVRLLFTNGSSGFELEPFEIVRILSDKILLQRKGALHPAHEWAGFTASG